MNSLKISDFKKPKYVIPTIVWIGLLLIPYLFVEVFNVEIEDKKDANLRQEGCQSPDNGVPECTVAIGQCQQGYW